mmetsp:Transcript_5938/g.21720  ORF Transcript_5938/g.21720 Transcript_5938/m.21720 type:complete len:1118 (-) Transcript_5938:1312-4665(-)
MGVPAFYRWLSDKYNLIIVDVVEEPGEVVDGVEVPPDFSQPNPNGREWDNLYLDMNGIIHPCFHPEDRPAPTTVAEVFKNIFTYIDRLFGMVRPRKLLYMAIDGVAPRAKMNQQRSRRFRAAQDAREKELEEDRLRKEMEMEGLKVPDKIKSEAFDSNVITPGTPFMAYLSVALQYYIHQRLNNDPGWSNIKVILSDANVPGEGEHKIMNYIRGQRGLPGFDPNTKHCLYGLDADLIMLALATHEAHFTILREVVTATSKDNKPTKDSLLTQRAEAARGGNSKEQGEADKLRQEIAKKPYQMVQINVLREYLLFELGVPNLPFKMDVERIVDDFVFMCFFCGNDFLPHMPTLEIREGAIDLLMQMYKQCLPEMGGYMVNGTEINLARVELFARRVASHEEAIFQKRARHQRRQVERLKQQKLQGTDSRAPYKAGAGLKPVQGFKGSRLASGGSNSNPYAMLAPDGPSGGGGGGGAPTNQIAAAMLRASLAGGASQATPNRSAAEKLKAQLQGGGSAENLGHLSKKARTASGSGSGSSLTDDNDDVAGSSERPAGFGVLARDGEGGGKDNATMDGELVDAVGAAASAAAHSAAQEAAAAAEFKTRLERSIKQKSDLSDKLDDDKVRLGEAGWKPRYYLQKFGVDIRTEEGRQLQRAVATSFVQGLVWTLRYYYQGVASWTWYFPYHYAPFASDLVDLQAMDISFEIGAPFKPFNQLMGVLPAASAHCLPKAYRPLMSEPSSPIVDFYPVQFEVDMNGKRWAWQGVALLPFIDEARLLTETARVEDTLTPDEARRNSQLSETIFCSAAHALAPTIYALYDKYSGASDPAARRAASATINPAASEHLNGTLRLCDGGGEACPPRFTSPVPGLPDVVPNSVVSAAFDNPTPRKHECRLPPGSVPDAPIVTAQDLKATVLWHEQGGNGRGRGRGAPAAGPLAPGAHRMLQHNLASQLRGGGAAYTGGFNMGRGRGRGGNINNANGSFRRPGGGAVAGGGSMYRPHSPQPPPPIGGGASLQQQQQQYWQQMTRGAPPPQQHYQHQPQQMMSVAAQQQQQSIAAVQQLLSMGQVRAPPVAHAPPAQPQQAQAHNPLIWQANNNNSNPYAAIAPQRRPPSDPRRR